MLYLVTIDRENFQENSISILKFRSQSSAECFDVSVPNEHFETMLSSSFRMASFKISTTFRKLALHSTANQSSKNSTLLRLKIRKI